MTWGQYYTPTLAGNCLVQGVSLEYPSRICDLGAGQGELLAAARRRWHKATLLAADIDPKNVQHTRRRLEQVICYKADVLRHDLPRLLGIEEESIDVALGNPPYGALEANSRHSNILRDAGLLDVTPMRRLTRDIVFLAQNLRLLKVGGELAVILPEGLAVNKTYEEFRGALLERHGLHRVLQLPAKLFHGTEARTVAMFFKKGQNSNGVMLESVGGRQIFIAPTEARKRLDACFHLDAPLTGQRLGDLEPEIFRGSLSHAEAKENGTELFHTTSFKLFPSGRVRFCKQPKMQERWIVHPGDILIPRVGSRCLYHAAIVEKGGAIFTDCVYRIRVAEQWRETVFQALRSIGGVTYRLTASHGTCAAVLSKGDLLDLPIE